MAKQHDPNLPHPNPDDQDPAKAKPPAPEEEELIILDADDDESAPGAPKARPTHLAPADAEAAPIPNAPNMSLDDEEALEVVEAVPVEEPPVFVATPVSEQAPPASSVIEVVPVEEEALAAEALPAVTSADIPEIEPEVVMEAEPVAANPADEDALAGEPLSTAAEATPLPVSVKLTGTPPSEVAMAHPVSDIVEAEPVSEVAAAEPVSDALEIEPAVAMTSDEVLFEDVVEGVPTAGAKDSSGTRKAEDVFGDEELGAGSAPAAEPISAVEFDDAVDLGAAPAEASDAAMIGKKGAARARDDEEVLDAEEAQAVGSSAVNWDEIGEPSGAKPAARLEETVAFEAPARDESGEDLLITEEEMVASADDDDASSVILGAKGPRSKPHSGVDPVAEALESGVNIDEAGGPVTPTDGPSVEFDEILEDEPIAIEPASKRVKKKPARDEEPLAVEGVGTDPEVEAMEGVPASKARKKSADDLEEEAAAALFDDEESVARPVEDEEAVAVGAEDDQPRRKNGKKAARANDDETAALPVEDENEAVAVPVDEDEEKPRKKKKGKGGTGTAPPVKPSYGTRWLGGMVVGTVLTAGALGAAWFVAPDTLQDVVNSSPNASPPKQQVVQQPQAPPMPLALQARAALDEGNYDEALTKLAEAPADDKAALAARGEARWLKYLKEQTEKKQPLDEKSKEVQDALKDLTDAGQPLRAEQVTRAITAGQMQGQFAKLTEADQALKEVQKALQDKDLVAADAPPKELPKAVTLALAGKKQADDQLTGVGQALVAAKVIDKADNLDATSLQKSLKDLADSKNTLTAVNKALGNAEVKDKGAKGVEELAAAKKDNDDKLAEVNKLLAGEKTKEMGAKGVQEVVEARSKLQKDRDDLEAVVKATADEFAKGQLLPKGADPRKQLAEAAKLARQKAESPLTIPLAEVGGALASLGTGTGRVVEKGFENSQLASELAFYKLREQFLPSPDQRLETEINLLQDRARANPKELAAAERQAEFVLSKEKAAPETRGKALFVTALALRNKEQFGEAKKALEGALKEVASVKDAGPWVEQAKQSLQELSDPKAFFLPKIERLQAEGSLKSALKEADVALKALPDNGMLLAERAQLRLDLARAGKGGKVAPEAQQAIRADAAAAAKDAAGAPEGQYALGQLEEALGNFGKAEQAYRQAIKANQGSPEDASKYRIALARLLQRERSPAAAPAQEPPPMREEKKAVEKKEEKTGSLAPARHELTTGVVHPVAYLLLTASIGAQPVPVVEDEDPAMAERIKESIDLAKQLIASKDPKVRGQGHVLLGMAMSKQGKRTEGLKECNKGLRLLYPGLEEMGWTQMIEQHPAFQQPDAPTMQNPVLAERSFGEGLHAYWTGRYADAEAQFKQAVGHFDQDARYLYFLGLSQLAQKTRAKRDAAFHSFELGAHLEAQSQPSVSDINASLERVQGQLRQLLDSFRNKSLAAAQ